MNPQSQPLAPEQLLVHARWVHRLAVKLVGDPNLADDVVQETWIAALEHPPQGDVQSLSVKSWLGKPVRNSVLQRFRGDSRPKDREHADARELEAKPQK